MFEDFYTQEDSNGNVGQPGQMKSYDCGYITTSNAELDAQEAGYSTLEEYLKTWWNEVSPDLPWTWEPIGSGYGYNGSLVFTQQEPDGGVLRCKEIYGQIMFDVYGPETLRETKNKKMVLNEFNVRNALNNIMERYGDFNEVSDPWREAEDAYLMGEKLPKGWETFETEDGETIYSDGDGNEYRKDEYGKFVPIENDSEGFDLDESGSGSNIPDDVQQDFTHWALEEAEKERMLGGPTNALGLMYEYYNEDNDDALYELVEKYKESRGIITEPDSQDDIWVSEEIRRAVNAWGYYNAQSFEEPEEDLEEMQLLREAIKSIIRETFMNRGLFGTPVSSPGDMQEKGHTKKSKWSPSNMHFKTNPKTARERRNTKRSIVIRWLRDPSVNCAEIMRLLWHPEPEDEDTKRGEFYKKRDGAINKDSGARYSFSDEEINSLYKIKSGRQ